MGGVIFEILTVTSVTIDTLSASCTCGRSFKRFLHVLLDQLVYWIFCMGPTRPTQRSSCYRLEFIV